jgi:hypothetical protein
MGADTEMETFFACYPHEVLVCADASSFKGFGGQLLVLVGDQMDT